MKRIQINHIRVDENILKEIKKHILPAWQKYMLIITMLIALTISIVLFVIGQYFQAIILLALAVACIIEDMWLSHQKIKRILNTMHKETEKDFNIYTLVFGNDAVTIRNCDRVTDNKMPYTTIRKLAVSENAYTLFGKRSQFAIIRKDSLKISEDELFNFLKTKPTKIKKWPKLNSVQ